MEHFRGANLDIGGKKPRPLPSLDGLLDEGYDRMSQALVFKSCDDVPRLIKSSIICEHSSVNFDHSRHIGLIFKGLLREFQGPFSFTGHFGHQGAMEDQKVVQSAGAQALN